MVNKLPNKITVVEGESRNVHTEVIEVHFIDNTFTNYEGYLAKLIWREVSQIKGSDSSKRISQSSRTSRHYSRSNDNSNK